MAPGLGEGMTLDPLVERKRRRRPASGIYGCGNRLDAFRERQVDEAKKRLPFAWTDAITLRTVDSRVLTSERGSRLGELQVVNRKCRRQRARGGALVAGRRSASLDDD